MSVGNYGVIRPADVSPEDVQIVFNNLERPRRS